MLSILAIVFALALSLPLLLMALKGLENEGLKMRVLVGWQSDVLTISPLLWAVKFLTHQDISSNPLVDVRNDE